MFITPINNQLIRLSQQGFFGAGGTGVSGSGAVTADHFIGVFTPTTHTVLRDLRQNPATDISADTPTNLFVIAYKNFNSPNYVLKLLRQHSDIDLPPPPQPETNTNFIAKFTPTSHNILRSLRQNSDNDINLDSPSNLFVIAYRNFTPPNKLLQSLRVQHTANDITAPPNFENPSDLFVIAYKNFNSPNYLLKSLRHHQDFLSAPPPPPSGSVRSITSPTNPYSKTQVSAFRSMTTGRI